MILKVLSEKKLALFIAADRLAWDIFILILAKVI